MHDGLAQVIVLCYSERFTVQQADARTLVTLLHVREILQHTAEGPAVVSEMLDDTRRIDLVDRIEAYKRGDTPISVPVALLTHHARGDSLEWLAEQTYLAPYPAGLGLPLG